jgi:hypothetical protein
MINLNRELADVGIQGQHGILNCGTRYVHYIAIRKEFQDKIEEIQANTELNTNQKKILTFILLPYYYLPNYTPEWNPDRQIVNYSLFCSYICSNSVLLG